MLPKVIIFSFIFLSVFCFGRFMSAELSHDEQYYVASAVALKDARLYKDIAYTQTPLMPWVYRAVLMVMGQDNALFWARITNWFLFLLSVIALFYMTKSLCPGLWLAWGISMLYASNHIVQFTAGYAWNHLPALALFLGSLAFAVRFVNSRQWVDLLWMGFFGGLAVSVKVVYLPFLFLLALGAVWLDGNGLRAFSKSRRALLFAVGMTAGLAPTIAYMLFYNQEFILFTYVYHQLTVLWYEGKGAAESMLLISRMHFLKRLFFQHPSNLFLLAFTGAACICAGVAFRNGQVMAGRLKWVVWLGGMALTGIAVVLIPKPLFPQYVVLLAPLALLFSVAALGCCSENLQRTAGRLVALAALMSLLVLVRGSGSLAAALDCSRWVPLKVSADSRVIAEIVPPGRKVATFAPIAVLQAERGVYGELLSGSFLYRVADYFSERERKKYNAVGPSSLKDMLETDKPLAVLVGFEPALDPDLEKFAREHGYREIAGRLNEGRIFIQ